VPAKDKYHFMAIGNFEGIRSRIPAGSAPFVGHSKSGLGSETSSRTVGDESSNQTFADFGLIEPLMNALSSLGHVEPTPIQRKAIGPALSGRDVLGCAQTGTGKTAAFTLPLLQRLVTQPRPESRSESASTRGGDRARPSPIRALVLSPTRELAAQIDESLGLYGEFCRVRHAMVCGGVGLAPQIRELRRGVDVLVATPGRLEDLISQGLVDLSHVEVLVLDEVDRMLDQGFLPAVRRLTAKIPKARQTLLFSATLPPELRKLALVLMSNPVEVAADHVASTPDAIEQVVYHVASQLKRQMLEHLVSDREMTRALVFTRTKHGADRVAKHLKAASIGADALHGGKTQSARERALSAFRDGSLRVLVATDLAARGIHVDGISHVINFDLPVDADNYVHRIGRTARAGATGKALSLCCSEERDVLQRIEKLIRRRLPVQETPQLLPPPPRVAGSNYREGDAINRVMGRSTAQQSQGRGQDPRRDGGQDRTSRQAAPAMGRQYGQSPSSQKSARGYDRAQDPRNDSRHSGNTWPRSRQPN